MNSAEKKFLYLALFLFALGGISRLGALGKLSPFETVSLPENYEIATTVAIVATADTTLDATVLDTLEVNEVEAASGDSKSKRAKAPKKKAPAFPLNINTASKEDLCFIKGIGPALAQRIIEHRETKGSFSSAKDLEKVSGIGTKKRQSIEEFVKFD
ncbi:MAG: helix-hairpin-helix domain-containing protein [Fibromonadaceae bacterium]|jgi:competence protein ComEA|nr:helix-hairpin-helix domain-containing protein [Fibromonadaceae bacterium]